MKNSLNLIFVALLLIVLGCACPDKLKELAQNNNSAAPTPTPFAVNANVVSNSAAPPVKTGSISMAKYNQIKNDMTYPEAVKIIGGEGSEVSSSEIGKFKTATYKWDGENYSYIILTFQNDKLMFKSQGGLK